MAGRPIGRWVDHSPNKPWLLPLPDPRSSVPALVLPLSLPIFDPSEKAVLSPHFTGEETGVTIGTSREAGCKVISEPHKHFVLL